MKQMDSEGLWLCRMQGTMFRESLKTEKSSSAVFIRRFMNSDVARRMDEGNFPYGSDPVVNEVVSDLNEIWPSEKVKETSSKASKKRS